MDKTSDLLNQGACLRKLREQTGLTREKFSEIVGISQHTLKGWETGSREITSQKALLLANMFKMLGVDTSPDFILKGEEDEASKAQKEYICIGTLTEEDKIRKEISFFKENNYSYILHQIEDSTMLPYFKKGDIVGGTKTYNVTDFNKYKGHCSLIETEDDRKVFRKILKVDRKKLDVCILNLSDPDATKPLESICATSIAVITRHWRLSEII